MTNKARCKGHEREQYVDGATVESRWLVQTGVDAQPKSPWSRRLKGK